MPGLDGFETSRILKEEVKKIDQSVVIIACSGESLN
jgi:CheY-like chemotaxis protein